MKDKSDFFNINPIQSNNPFSKNFENESSSVSKRLNGYDSLMLNEDGLAHSETLKIEYKIAEHQKAISELNVKIKNAQIYGTQNEILSLRAKKQRLEKELLEFNRQNSVKSAGELSGESLHIPGVKKAQEFFSRYVLAKVSNKFKSLVFLGDSLNKLSEISKSVDELIALDVPYGERQQNYEKLTGYIYQANQIHSQISKTMSGGKK